MSNTSRTARIPPVVRADQATNPRPVRRCVVRPYGRTPNGLTRDAATMPEPTQREHMAPPKVGPDDGQQRARRSRLILRCLCGLVGLAPFVAVAVALEAAFGSLPVGLVGACILFLVGVSLYSLVGGLSATRR